MSRVLQRLVLAGVGDVQDRASPHAPEAHGHLGAAGQAPCARHGTDSTTRALSKAAHTTSRPQIVNGQD